MSQPSRKSPALCGLAIAAAAWSVQIVSAQPTPVFHLDFSTAADVSGNDIPIEFKAAVSLSPGGGPTLATGRTLDSATWAGAKDDTNQIVIFDHPLLDQVATGAGSIVAWINVADELEWNNIIKTPCPDHMEPCDAFGRFRGIELHADGSIGPGLGVVGSVQGWGEVDGVYQSVFGPNYVASGRPAGSETPTGVWTHTALTWEADGTHSIYVDGVQGMLLVGPPMGLNDPGNWTIGGDLHNRPSRLLRGQLADLAIFDATLSQDQINQIMELGVQSFGGPPLRAGDANQDLAFDQSDLIQIQRINLYLTGRPATWGEGDWNGAPGGRAGSPPKGDGVFDQIDLLAALAESHYATGPYAALSRNGREGDDQTSIVYHVDTGQVSVDAPAAVELTSINIDSSAGIFTGSEAQNLGGSFDNDADANIFKATFGGSFGSLSFGNVAATGLTEGFLLGDLTVVGSLAGGGALGDVDLIYVPEPSGGLLATIALLVIIGMNRRNGLSPRLF